jgi:hypothetical protein
MTIQQLLEIERAFREMASKTRNKQAARILSALADRYKALAAEQQSD